MPDAKPTGGGQPHKPTGSAAIFYRLSMSLFTVAIEVRALIPRHLGQHRTHCAGICNA